MFDWSCRLQMGGQKHVMGLLLHVMANVIEEHKLLPQRRRYSVSVCGRNFMFGMFLKEIGLHEVFTCDKLETWHFS